MQPTNCRPSINSIIVLAVFLATICCLGAMGLFKDTFVEREVSKTYRHTPLTSKSTIQTCRDTPLKVKSATVAHCIVGLPFGLAFTHESIKRGLIDHFGENHSQSDVFLVLGAAGMSTHFEAEYGAAMQTLNPVVVKFTGNEPRVDINCTEYPLRKHVKPNSYYAQFKKIDECYRQILDRENFQGWKYEWLVRSRPDIKWLDPLPVTISSASNSSISAFGYSNGVSDHWAVVPRQIGDVYFSAYRADFNCTMKENFIPYCFLIQPEEGYDWPNECKLCKWLADHGAPVSSYNATFDLLDANGHARRHIFNGSIKRPKGQYVPKQLSYFADAAGSVCT